jgi:hypothetical protein
MCWSSGLKATDQTSFVCPASDATSFLPDRTHLHQPVVTSRNNIRLPIGTEGDRKNPIRVSSQRHTELLPRRHRPHLHQGVVTSGNNMLPIGRTTGLPGERTTLVCPASERRSLLSSQTLQTTKTFTNLSSLPAAETILRFAHLVCATC